MKILFILIVITAHCSLLGQIKVVTTTTVIYDLVKNIGGDKVEVQYLSRGDQDVHYLEILPSYMIKLRNADIFFKIGLDLERWSDQLVDGSRNTDLIIVDLSKAINPKEVPTTRVDASQGDIHPFGNPHYWLDPDNVLIMLIEIFEALSNQSPENTNYFKSNLDSYVSVLENKITEWDLRMVKMTQREIIFFHASWIYFVEKYNLKIAGYVEPKPGIPPTPSHNAEIIRVIEEKKIKIIIMDVFYSDNASNQIANITGVKVLKLPTQVFGLENIQSYIQLMDYLSEEISFYN